MGFLDVLMKKKSMSGTARVMQQKGRKKQDGVNNMGIRVDH